MDRRTKIIATIGPASDSEPTLRELVNAGMDVARLGLAHGTLDEALERYDRIRKVSKDMGKRVGILVDLPGPKIRSAPFPSDGSVLEKDTIIKLIPGTSHSSENIVEVEYENVLDDLVPGDVIPFGDGQVVVRVEDIGSNDATATVTSGGVLHGRPGIRIPSERLSLPTPTDDDLQFEKEPALHHRLQPPPLPFLYFQLDLKT